MRNSLMDKELLFENNGRLRDGVYSRFLFLLRLSLAPSLYPLIYYICAVQIKE